MYSSFYAAAVGAMGQQAKLDVVSNNLANINTAGYKAKVGAFQDLMYYNLNNFRGDETSIQAGTGIRLEKADTNFNPVGFEITYTRNGRFSLSQRGDEFYLVNDSGKLVLDRNQNPIRLTGNVSEGEEPGLSAQPAVYDFRIKNGMQNVGDNEYMPVEKNGEPVLTEELALQRALEMSGTDLAMDLVRMIESQRAFSYALKMVQTSDEVVQTVNGLRA